MLKIRNIWFFLLLIAGAGCQTANIPTPYNYRVKELQKNPFGCWMEVKVNTSGSVPNIQSLAGELLAMRNDSSFLLTADGVVSGFRNFSVVSARLYTHKNQGGTYMLSTGLLILPSIIGAAANPDYAGEFLMLGIPAFITGITQTVIESSNKSNILVYPEKNSLDNFRKFSRFPGGMPENIDFRLLYLKKMQ